MIPTWHRVTSTSISIHFTSWKLPLLFNWSDWSGLPEPIPMACMAMAFDSSLAFSVHMSLSVQDRSSAISLCLTRQPSLHGWKTSLVFTHFFSFCSQSFPLWLFLGNLSFLTMHLFCGVKAAVILPLIDIPPMHSAQHRTQSVFCSLNQSHSKVSQSGSNRRVDCSFSFPW